MLGIHKVSVGGPNPSSEVVASVTIGTSARITITAMRALAATVTRGNIRRTRRAASTVTLAIAM